MSNVRGEHITPALAASIIASVRSAFAVSAKAAYQRALDRKDTRRQHDTWAALRAARVAQLIAEQAERDRRKGLFRRLLSWGRSNA